MTLHRQQIRARYSATRTGRECQSNFTVRPEFIAWGLLYLNLLLVFPRGTSVTGLDPQSAYRIVTVMGAAVLLSSSVFAAAHQVFRVPLLFMFVYSISAIVSSTYATIPAYSLWKAIEITIGALAVAVFVNKRDAWPWVTKLYELTLILIGVTALSAVIGVVLWPNEALLPERGLIPFRLYGVRPYLNSNSLGALAAISAFACIIRGFRGRSRSKRFMVLGAVFFGMLVLTTSRTAMLAFLAGLTAFAVFEKRKSLLVVLGGGVTTIVFVGIVQQYAMIWFAKGQSVELLKTLTGRTVGWSMAWSTFVESPWFGHGIASAGRFDVLEGELTTLHGSVFDVLVGVGIIGTIPWLVAITATGIMLLKSSNKHPEHPAFSQWLQLRPELLGVYVILIVRASSSTTLAFHEREEMLFLALLAISMVSLGLARGPGFRRYRLATDRAAPARRWRRRSSTRSTRGTSSAGALGNSTRSQSVHASRILRLHAR